MTCMLSTPNPPGGSGTETVGVLMDTLKVPVFRAQVSMIPLDSSGIPAETLRTETDFTGTYRIQLKKTGIYYALKAKNRSNTLFYDTIFFKKDSLFLFLDTGIMHAPGAIKGKVLVNLKAKPGVHVYVPGTGYDAFSDDSGRFKILNLPKGIYTLYYDYDNPKCITGKEFNLSVLAGDTLFLPGAKNLLYDTAGKPFAPENVSLKYDTLTGKVNLSWSRVNIMDVSHYKVFKDTIVQNQSMFAFIGATNDTQYTTECLTGIPDTLDPTIYHFRFNIRTVDTFALVSDPSPAAGIDAVSPTWVRTFFRWEKVPKPTDTILNNQTVTIRLSFNNKTRINDSLIWRTSPGNTVIRKKKLHDLAGSDTLTYQWGKTGSYTMTCTSWDNAGCQWVDSQTIVIQDSSVLYPPDTWTLLKPVMNKKRRFHSLVANNNTLYALGGAYTNPFDGKQELPLDAAESFQLADSSWKPINKIPTLRFKASTVVYGDKIYVIGGTNGQADYKTMEIYNLQSNSWEPAQPIPEIFVGSASCLYKDKIFVFGGMASATTFSRSVYSYDSTGKWKKIGDLLGVPRAFHQATLLNGKLYILGGIADYQSDPVASIEVFDPVSLTCSTLGSFSQCARAFFGAASSNGKIYLAGGITAVRKTRSVIMTTAVDAFDPLTMSFISKKPLNSQLCNFAMCSVNNFLYISGGSSTGPTPEPYNQDNKVYRYNP